MVVVGCEDVATVVPLSFDLGDDIETLIVLQELVVHIGLYALHTLNGLWRYPDDGFVDHSFSVCLKELDRCLQRIEESCVGALSCLLELGENLAMTVGEPELAGNHAVGILRLGQVGQ